MTRVAVTLILAAKILAGQTPSPLGGTPQIDIPAYTALYTGRIVLADGTPLPARPLIASNCGPPKIEGGEYFTYEFSTEGSLEPDRVGRVRRCLLSISLAGFRSVRAELTDGMVVTLQRLEENEGSAVSFTSLKAPSAAVKEFHKGHMLLYRKDTRGAMKAFERAVALYPGYASAWDDLGVLRERQGQAQAAIEAYEKAVELDGRFIQPLYHLARLAAEQGQWESALLWAERAMGLNAVEFPGIYLAHGIAAMNLGRPLILAERSLRRAAQLDTDNLLPRAHYLLGLVLQQKGDAAGAALCFQNYLIRTKDPGELAKARQKLAELGAAR